MGVDWREPLDCDVGLTLMKGEEEGRQEGRKQGGKEGKKSDKGTGQ